MPDSRFFTRSAALPLSRLAELTGAALQGADSVMQDVAPLETAAAAELSFLDNVKYLSAFRASKAGACFVREKYAAQAPPGMALLLTEEPYAAYARAAQLFYPEPQAAETRIHPSAVIGENVTLGARCTIGPNVWIGDGVALGDDCRIGANSTVSHALIGNHVTLHRGVHIGQDGFGYAPTKQGVLKVPQLGRVVIEDGVEIGSGTCIDRGAGPDTVIGAHTKIDNLVQIGHNCRIGRHVFIAGQAGLAGSTKVEDGAMIGGQVGSAGHITIGAGAKLAAQCGIMTDVPPGAAYGGFPAQPIRDWHRQTAALAKLAKRGKPE